MPTPEEQPGQLHPSLQVLVEEDEDTQEVLKSEKFGDRARRVLAELSEQLRGQKTKKKKKRK